MEQPSESWLDSIAGKLIDDHYDMLKTLIYYRTSKGIPIEVVAERMSVSTKDAEEFEAYYANPDLNTIRRYCLAIGVYLQTSIIDVPT